MTHPHPANAAASLQLAALYERRYDALVSMATGLVDSRAEAEDIVQEAFARCLDAWRRDRAPSAPESYVRQAVVNLSRNRIRRRMLGRRIRLAAAHGEPSAEAVHDAAELGALAAAVRALPRRQRECVVLRYVEDLSVAECADALGISEGAVKTHSARGRRQLGIRMEAQRERD